MRFLRMDVAMRHIKFHRHRRVDGKQQRRVNVADLTEFEPADGCDIR